MAWTAPRTWVTAEVVTASIMNTDVRDNFLETGPFHAANVGGFIAVDGTNSLVERNVGGASTDASETTASTSYTDLTTAGPAVAVVTGTRAIVFLTCRLSNNTAGVQALMGYAVSGATTVSATDLRAVEYESSVADDHITVTAAFLHGSLTAGNNTFTCKYRVSANTGTFRRRGVTIFPA